MIPGMWASGEGISHPFPLLIVKFCNKAANTRNKFCLANVSPAQRRLPATS